MIPSGKLKEQSLLLIHAYVDGELDPTSALAVAQQIEAEPELAAARDWIVALQDLIRVRYSREVPPSGLRARVETAVERERF